MFYAKFQYCRNLRKEIDNLERISQHRAQSVHKDYEKQRIAEQTKKEAKNEYQKIKQEIEDWLATAPLAPAYKESIIDYYIKGATNKVNNIEREIKDCLGEYIYKNKKCSGEE